MNKLFINPKYKSALSRLSCFFIALILISWPPHPGSFGQSNDTVFSAIPPHGMRGSLQKEKAKEQYLIKRINNTSDTIAQQVKDLTSKKTDGILQHRGIKIIERVKVDTLYLTEPCTHHHGTFIITSPQSADIPILKAPKKSKFFKRIFHKKNKSKTYGI